MEKLDQKDQERVNASFEAGAKDFSKENLDELLGKEEKVEKKSKYLGDRWNEYKLFFKLLKDYKNGKYPNVPWKFIASAGFAIAYFLNPFDVIPDIIPLAGYVDDIAILGLVSINFASEIEAYKNWKNK